MTKTELQTIVNDTAGIYTPEQKAKATQALAEYDPNVSAGFNTLIGSHSCLGETRHFQITVESEYAAGLLSTRTMDEAAKQACNDKLLMGLRARYDTENEFQKRFPKDCYKLIRVEKRVAA